MIYLSRSIVDEIEGTIGQLKAEHGGVLGCKGSHICKFYYDYSADTGPAFYSPSDRVEEILQQWAKDGVGFAGFIHSHMGRFTPTHGDISYSQAVFDWFTSLFPALDCSPIVTVVDVPLGTNPLQHIFAYPTDWPISERIHLSIVDACAPREDKKEPMRYASPNYPK